MGDLISRSALIDNLREIKTLYGVPMTKRDEQMIHWVIGHIKEQPTAYDLEKVLNDLDEKSSRCKIRSRSIFSDDDYRFNDLKRYEKHSSDMQAYAYDTAIDIVKAGGVE